VVSGEWVSSEAGGKWRASITGGIQYTRYFVLRIEYLALNTEHWVLSTRYGAGVTG